MQCFGNAATNVIQENSSMVQTKLGNGPSIVANKIKLIESQMTLQGLCALQLSAFSLVGENVVCAEAVGGETPLVMLLQLWASGVYFYYGTMAQKRTCFYASSASLSFSPLHVWDRRELGCTETGTRFREILRCCCWLLGLNFMPLMQPLYPSPLPWSADQGIQIGLSHLSEDQCRNPTLLDDFLNTQCSWCCLCHQSIWEPSGFQHILSLSSPRIGCSIYHTWKWGMQGGIAS